MKSVSWYTTSLPNDSELAPPSGILENIDCQNQENKIKSYKKRNKWPAKLDKESVSSYHHFDHPITPTYHRLHAQLSTSYTELSQDLYVTE
eukprot:UN09957